MSRAENSLPETKNVDILWNKRWSLSAYAYYILKKQVLYFFMCYYTIMPDGKNQLFTCSNISSTEYS